MPDEKPPIPMFERRRIEAEILKHVHDTLKETYGVDVAGKIIAEAVRKSSVAQAAEFAAKAGGNTSMQTFVDRQALWTAGGALEIGRQGADRGELRLQRHALPVCRDVPRDGAGRDRSPAVLPA